MWITEAGVAALRESHARSKRAKQVENHSVPFLEPCSFEDLGII